MNIFRKSLSLRKAKKGFSLIELVIIVGIIGIIAALATPLYLSYRKKAIQVEAKTNLLDIYKFEIMYFSENQEFTADKKKLGFDPKSNPRYEYEIVAIGNSFTAKAIGNIDNDDVQDVWTINDKQALVHLTVD
ncbi:MAG: prepilin-type N-terminal cleavage/methylation domain-containing protein [Candidatus Schekmanbacteria bacterium]|nr:MAG: prepilin-type N-terminal cleavage/methylation domain-containing protein [Candidatus Schekmanbacteria bacterium]